MVENYSPGGSWRNVKITAASEPLTLGMHHTGLLPFHNETSWFCLVSQCKILDSVFIWTKISSCQVSACATFTTSHTRAVGFWHWDRKFFVKVIKIIRMGKEYINPFQRTFLWVHKIKWLAFRRRCPACSFSVTELCVRKFRTAHWCRKSRVGLGLPTLVQFCLQRSATKGLSWNSIRPNGQPWRGCWVAMNGNKWCTERPSTRTSTRHSLLSKCRTFYGSCLSVVMFTPIRKLLLFLEPIFTKVASAQWHYV
jgi:hypothetical protein